MADDLRAASPGGYARLLAAYPGGAGGLDLQPFFDLITIHELGHAFEVLGDLRLPTFWLSEIFVNVALHAFVATRLAASLPTLEVLSTVGAGSRQLAARMRAEGYSTLDELQADYPGSEEPMSPLNYVWFQYRWQRSRRRCSMPTVRTGWSAFGIASTQPIASARARRRRRRWPRF